GLRAAIGLPGALAGAARTASLVAVLVVLPIVFLGLLPSEIFPAAAWASDALPFVHAYRLFDASLYDFNPWGAVLREALWLLGLGTIFATLARSAVRTLGA